ncbi:hypothetical protein COK98_08930 [Bacillus cereus]|uniref:Uncharacterized protein n=1 Tax=Bacillus cereus TaxID=1396 RepID=A0A9X7BD66_BACCE|nr:hypothetical protein COK98_08930 [Bacillus cereus]
MKNKFEKLSLDTLRSIVEKEISRGETWRADNKKYFLFSSCEGEGLKKTGGATCFFFFFFWCFFPYMDVQKGRWWWK